MKKLNNKGFAISALVYGLSIMGILIVAILMKTVSSTRENQRLLAEQIEDELNTLGMSSNSYAPSDVGQVFTAQEDGLYRIELWGAAGGNGSGGKGSYTTGIIQLKEGDNLYFYVGKKTANGGEETDVRVLSNGGYSGHDSYETRIMVAAGGGKDAGADGKGLVRSDSLKLNPPSLDGVVDGGHGYIPGATSTDGGSSFISGYAGSQAINGGKVPGTSGYIETPTYKYFQIKSFDASGYKYETFPGQKYYFVDGLIIPGVNDGDGKALIKILNGTVDDKRKSKIEATSIKACYTGDVANNELLISAVGNGGEEYALIKTISHSGKCYTVNLGAKKSIDEIAILNAKNNDYTIETINDNKTLLTKAKKNSNGEVRFSSFQPYGNNLPDTASYYIGVTGNEKEFLTPNTDGYTYLKPLTGEKSQIWEITKIAANKYKIVESSKYYALERESQSIGEFPIVSRDSFNSISEVETQLFNIIPNNDGTYRIEPYPLNKNFSLAITTGKQLVIKAKSNDDSQKFRLIQLN